MVTWTSSILTQGRFASQWSELFNPSVITQIHFPINDDKEGNGLRSNKQNDADTISIVHGTAIRLLTAKIVETLPK